MKVNQIPEVRGQRPEAFTMIEIAISLAVIGFALIAIIGILPFGMNAQKENRQETIINQDATMWMEALRSGAQGSDDLTNYVMAITNYVVRYNAQGARVSGVIPHGFTFQGSTDTPQFPITNGFRIVGLLSTPKIVPLPRNSGFLSNHVVAFVRSISGPASEKPPQNNAIIQDMALSYRLISDISAYSTNFFDANWTNYADPRIAGNTNEITTRSNYAILVRNFQANLHDVRLTFRWPLLPNGDAGPERLVFRSMLGGWLLNTNQYGYPPGVSNLYFFQPRTYLQVKAS